MSASSADLPIAVFDSGLGGLTVLKALAQALPQENFLYLGDTARLPYGSKSLATIRRYVKQNIDFLTHQKVKAIIVACNSASTVLISEKLDCPVPLYNVIAPGAAKAAGVSASKRIGVIGTRATVKGKAYVQELCKNDSTCEVFQQACPLFVSLVEEGWVDDPITNLVAYRYIQPLMASGIDTLILGCTHYPILKTAIQKVTGSQVTLVDSAQAIAELIAGDLKDHVILPRAQKTLGQLDIMTTDNADQFEQVAKLIMNPLPLSKLSLVDIQ